MDQPTKPSTPPAFDDELFDQRLAVARKLGDQRQFADAIVLFNWLCDAYPNRAAAFIDSANIFSRVYDYTAVAARFAQVESKVPAPPEVWLAMAEISERLRRPAWARRFLGNAVANAAPSAEACGLFAIYLEHANELNPAAEMLERGLKIDPANATCQLARARLARRSKQFDQAEKSLTQLLTRSNAIVQTRISALYELANVKDGTDDCAGAMDALKAAKQLSATLPEFLTFQERAVGSARNHHRFLTTLNESYFQTAAAWQPAQPRRLALLGGHPRSGTTLLEQILDSHSQIVSAEETSIFGNGVYDAFINDLKGPDLSQAALQLPPDRLEQFRTVYFSTMQALLDRQLGDQLLVDKNPSYTDCIPAFSRVFPEAKFIIALRDPRDVVLSCYFQNLPVNDVTVHFQSPGAAAMRYANTMAMWLVCRENMDQSRWTEVRYESLVSDLPGEAKKVMNFLQLDWQDQQQHPQDHARTRIVQSPTYAQVVQPVHSKAVGRWKRYEPWLGEALPILETFIEAFEY